MVGIALMALALAACGGSLPGSAQATARFAECLERNGIVTESVEVTLDDDGTIASISATVVSEGNVPYDVVRMACTDEVESFVAGE